METEKLRDKLIEIIREAYLSDPTWHELEHEVNKMADQILALFNSEGRKVIGQCGSCKLWITRDGETGNCGGQMDGIYTKNYGCWFWKVRILAKEALTTKSGGRLRVKEGAKK